MTWLRYGGIFKAKQRLKYCNKNADALEEKERRGNIKRQQFEPETQSLKLSP